MKRLIPIISMAGLLGALASSGCGDGPAQAAASPAARDPLSIKATPELTARIELGEAGETEVRETLHVSGRVEADETRMARVGSPVTGRITDLAATVGQDVLRGQVLATINSTDLSTAQLGYLKSLSQRQLAERGASRARQLYEVDVIGSAELQRRQSELALAEAEASATRDQLKVLGMPESAIDRLAETRTINSLAQIVSSVSGTVIERKVTEGQVVQPADTVFLVADLSRLWVVADIPEQSAGAVRVGEAVSVEIAAFPGRQFAGALSFVSPIVSPETRTVRARMDLPNSQREFKPAMLASVLIQGKPQTRPVVPITALVREENRDYVFVQIAADSYRLREVALGAESEDSRVLLGGLRAGERIVVDGAFHLNNERKRRGLDGG